MALDRRSGCSIMLGDIYICIIHLSLLFIENILGDLNG